MWWKEDAKIAHTNGNYVSQMIGGKMIELCSLISKNCLSLKQTEKNATWL